MTKVLTETNFGIVMKVDDNCPWYNINQDYDSNWIIEHAKFNNYYFGMICCHPDKILIELSETDDPIKFLNTAKKIATFLGITIPPNGNYEHNIREKDFRFNLCYPEKTCQCT